VVVGAIQDPRKDVIPQRDLFPIRIGLRVNEAEHVRLSLGSDAHNRGAACDLHPVVLRRRVEVSHGRHLTDHAQTVREHLAAVHLERSLNRHRSTPSEIGDWPERP
jgi:hypothetical protein